MDRILQNAPATLSETWYEDGSVVDPGIVTIGITRADGTEVVAAGTATNGTGAAARTYDLSKTYTATLDTLTVTWTSGTKGSRVAYVEVVGGFLFTVNDARTATFMGGALTSTATYSTATIVAMRTVIEDALQDACGVSFIPRAAIQERHDGDGTTDLFLHHSRPLSVTAASVDGIALTQTQLDTLVTYPDGRLYYPSGWTCGRGNVLVSYTHGYQSPPGRIQRAALLLLKRFLVDSPVSDRATSLHSPDGTTQFLVTAGVRSAIFDIPEANAAVNEYQVPLLG